MAHLEHITVALPAEMASTIKHAVESGEYTSNSEVFYDAIRDWEQKRQLQHQEVERIKGGIQRGMADLLKGRTKPADEVLTRLENKYQAAV